MAVRKNAAQSLRDKTLQAALVAVDRLRALLRDPQSSQGDVLKAAAMIFDRVSLQQGGGGSGDFEIVVKED